MFGISHVAQTLPFKGLRSFFFQGRGPAQSTLRSFDLPSVTTAPLETSQRKPLPGVPAVQSHLRALAARTEAGSVVELTATGLPWQGLRHGS